MTKLISKLFATALVAMAIPTISAGAAEVEINSSNMPTTLQGGNTYNVVEDVDFTERIEVNGDVTLNIASEVTLTAEKGIQVAEGNSITIDGDDGTETLIAGNNLLEEAAIGGNKGENAGSITIQNATITVSSYGGTGVGGGRQGDGGNITITNSTIEASSIVGAGVGGGALGDGGNITITNSTVDASSFWGAGIGGGEEGDGGNITIKNSIVEASSTTGAGIGGGRQGDGGKLTITNSIVEAYSNMGVPIGDADGEADYSKFTGYIAGNFYGKSLTIYNDFEVNAPLEVPKDFTITIASNALVINKSVITNNGTIIIYKGSTLLNDKNIINNGIIENGGAIGNSGGNIENYGTFNAYKNSSPQSADGDIENKDGGIFKNIDREIGDSTPTTPTKKNNDAEEEVLVKPIIEGKATRTIELDKELVLSSNANYFNYMYTLVNEDTKLGRDYLNFDPTTTTITIPAEFIEALGKGEHKVEMVFSQGRAETTFIVE